jgi:hypothetical protein
MKPQKILFIALAISGCGSSSDDGLEARPPGPAAAAVVAAATPAFDRKQSAYVVTSLKSRAGAEFRSGRARLEVVESDGRPSFTFELVAQRGDEEIALHVNLGDRAPAAQALSFERLDGGKHGLALRRIVAERAEPQAVASGRLVLSREQHGDSRPRLAGTLDTDGPETSFSFSTEFEFECLVPASEIGGAEAVAEITPGARLLVQDDAFETRFCRQFEALR